MSAASLASSTRVTALPRTIRVRILRLLARRGLDPGADVTPPDPLAEVSPALAGLSRASVQGRVALGRQAGARLLALGRDPDALWATAGGRRHAHLDGFDLHANVAVRGEDRDRLEQLCRYLLRPAVAQERLRLSGDGRIVLTLKAAWADGTTHPRVRAAGTARAARGADPAATDQPDRLPWGAGPARQWAEAGGHLMGRSRRARGQRAVGPHRHPRLAGGPGLS